MYFLLYKLTSLSKIFIHVKGQTRRAWNFCPSSANQRHFIMWVGVQEMALLSFVFYFMFYFVFFFTWPASATLHTLSKYLQNHHKYSHMMWYSRFHRIGWSISGYKCFWSIFGQNIYVDSDPRRFNNQLLHVVWPPNCYFIEKYSSKLFVLCLKHFHFQNAGNGVVANEILQPACSYKTNSIIHLTDLTDQTHKNCHLKPLAFVLFYTRQSTLATGPLNHLVFDRIKQMSFSSLQVLHFNFR